MCTIGVNPGYEDDFLLAEAALANQTGSASLLRDRFHSTLVATLISRGASQTESEDIVADLWSDCFGARTGKEPLLGKYQGRSSLKSWLTTVATNRLIDFKRRGRFVGDLPGSGEDGEENAFDNVPWNESQCSEKSLLKIARLAVSEGFQTCGAEDMAMLKLVYLHDLTQREIAQMWGCHESKISRVLTGAMRTIQDTALSALKRMDPWLELQWNDLLEICESLSDSSEGTFSLL